MIPSAHGTPPPAPPPEKDPGTKDDVFYRWADLWLWCKETVRWHWWEIMIITGAVWATLVLALFALNAV